MTNTQSIPEYLKRQGLFCLWKYETDSKGRRTKMPYNPNKPQEKGRSNDRSTFAPLDIAAARARGFDGLGIGIFDAIAAIDIDHCIDNGKLSDMAADIVELMDAYTEISPSGAGLRILFLAPNFQYDTAKYYINNQDKGLEIYLPGMTNKYVTVTGNTQRKRDMMDRADRLQAILDKYMKRKQAPQTAAPMPGGAADLSDYDLIEKAKAAANGRKFAELWDGGLCGYPSQSEADQALCNMLAFWTGKDATRMESLFRQSGLNRETGGKYKSPAHYAKYLRKTIEKAISSCGEVYTPRLPDAKPLPRSAPQQAADGSEPPQAGEEPPETEKGLLTIDRAIKILKAVDDHYLQMPKFPQLSSVLKLKTHDSVVIAADTGAGKSSLALNILHELQDRYPALYINLEMDEATILQRLVAIHTGMELDQVEGYKHDSNTRAAVDAAINEILSRKEIRLLTDAYSLREIEAQIQAATQGREDPTIVFIDTALLVTIGNKSASRYERFTQISEELRRISRLNNVVMFVLLQQNRDGKKDEKKEPTNSSLKESGSWENDATKIVFLTGDGSGKQLTITKNRSGKTGTFKLNYAPHTQTYSETKNSYTPPNSTPAGFREIPETEPDDDNPFMRY